METKNVLSLANEIRKEIVEIRRTLHAWPELAFSEEKTAALIADKLDKFGIFVETGIAQTGVIGTIEGGKPGKTVLIRADMDALPVQELNDIACRSQREGIMHACGHDAHVACALGAAYILKEMAPQLSGRVKIMFQPAEEVANGGAQRMIDAGVLEHPKVDAAIAAHMSPDYPAGTVAVRAGPTTANPDFFTITITGKGSHGGEPQNSVDPIFIGNLVYTAFQGIVSRWKDPMEPAVISVCKMQAGNSLGVVPETFEMGGTVRTFNETSRKAIHGRMDELLQGVCKAYGVKGKLEVVYNCCPVVNHPEITEAVKCAAEKVLGKKDAVVEARLFTGGEDFCYIARLVPACYLFVGVKNIEKNITYPLHNARFDVDEEVLHKAAAVLAQSCIDLLS